MEKYPKYLLEHFQNPKNVGEILNPDGIGTTCNAACGDIMQMFIRCDGNRISEATFKAFGCGVAIAASLILTQRIKGVTIDEAIEISERISGEILPHLPEDKTLCFKMVANALRQAIEEHKENHHVSSAGQESG